MADRDASGLGAAQRRRGRQLRAFHRHVQMAVKLALATAHHHSAQPAGPVVAGPLGGTARSPCGSWLAVCSLGVPGAAFLQRAALGHAAAGGSWLRWGGRCRPCLPPRADPPAAAGGRGGESRGRGPAVVCTGRGGHGGATGGAGGADPAVEPPHPISGPQIADCHEAEDPHHCQHCSAGTPEEEKEEAEEEKAIDEESTVLLFLVPAIFGEIRTVLFLTALTPSWVPFRVCSCGPGVLRARLVVTLLFLCFFVDDGDQGIMSARVRGRYCSEALGGIRLGKF